MGDSERLSRRTMLIRTAEVAAVTTAGATGVVGVGPDAGEIAGQVYDSANDLLDRLPEAGDVLLNGHRDRFYDLAGAVWEKGEIGLNEYLSENPIENSFLNRTFETSPNGVQYVSRFEARNGTAYNIENYKIDRNYYNLLGLRQGDYELADFSSEWSMSFGQGADGTQTLIERQTSLEITEKTSMTTISMIIFESVDDRTGKNAITIIDTTGGQHLITDEIQENQETYIEMMNIFLGQLHDTFYEIEVPQIKLGSVADVPTSERFNEDVISRDEFFGPLFERFQTYISEPDDDGLIELLESVNIQSGTPSDNVNYRVEYYDPRQEMPFNSANEFLSMDASGEYSCIDPGNFNSAIKALAGRDDIGHRISSIVLGYSDVSIDKLKSLIENFGQNPNKVGFSDEMPVEGKIYLSINSEYGNMQVLYSFENKDSSNPTRFVILMNPYGVELRYYDNSSGNPVVQSVHTELTPLAAYQTIGNVFKVEEDLIQ